VLSTLLLATSPGFITLGVEQPGPQGSLLFGFCLCCQVAFPLGKIARMCLCRYQDARGKLPAGILWPALLETLEVDGWAVMCVAQGVVPVIVAVHALVMCVMLHGWSEAIAVLHFREGRGCLVRGG